jgi:hypothetical protein
VSQTSGGRGKIGINIVDKHNEGKIRREDIMRISKKILS